MSIQDLKAKYGGNRKSDQLINAAIRAEIIGGDDAIEAMLRLHAVVRKLRDRGYRGADEAQQALDAARKVVEIMADEVAIRYGLTRRPIE